MPPITLDSFNQMASSVADANSERALRVESGQVALPNRFSSLFISKSENRATMDAFIDAVKEKHGENAGKMVATMLAGAREDGKPLTARMVSQLTAMAANEELKSSTEGAAWANKVDAEAAELARLGSMGNRPGQAREELLNNLSELIQSNPVQGRSAALLREAMNKLNPAQRQNILNIVGSNEMRNTSAFIARHLLAASGGKDEKGINPADQNEELRNDYKEVLDARLLERDLARNLLHSLADMETLARGEELPGFDGYKKDEEIFHELIRNQPAGDRGSVTVPDYNAVGRILPNLTNGIAHKTNIFFAAQRERNPDTFLRGNSPIVSDARGMARTAFEMSDFNNRFASLCDGL
ncbi:MAG: hypothetical protein LBD82_04915, partial [Deltaproteobacteria bacterium]|nr:hypothetical protein [Deltaproteobacteria bacterium]